MKIIRPKIIQTELRSTFETEIGQIVFSHDQYSDEISEYFDEIRDTDFKFRTFEISPKQANW